MYFERIIYFSSLVNQSALFAIFAIEKKAFEMKINGHGHILPEPSDIPKFMKDKKLFWRLTSLSRGSIIPSSLPSYLTLDSVMMRRVLTLFESN